MNVYVFSDTVCCQAFVMLGSNHMYVPIVEQYGNNYSYLYIDIIIGPTVVYSKANNVLTRIIPNAFNYK